MAAPLSAAPFASSRERPSRLDDLTGGASSWAAEYQPPSSKRTGGRSAQEWLDLAVASIEQGAGSRHDVTLRAVEALVRFRDEGDEDAEALIETLGERFVAVVTDDGSRHVREAKAEFDRMVRGAVVKVVSRTPSASMAAVGRDQ